MRLRLKDRFCSAHHVLVWMRLAALDHFERTRVKLSEIDDRRCVFVKKIAVQPSDYHQGLLSAHGKELCASGSAEIYCFLRSSINRQSAENHNSHGKTRPRHSGVIDLPNHSEPHYYSFDAPQILAR